MLSPSTRRVATAAGVPVIPATEVLGEDMALIKRQAAEAAEKAESSESDELLSEDNSSGGGGPKKTRKPTKAIKAKTMRAKAAAMKGKPKAIIYTKGDELAGRVNTI